MDNMYNILKKMKLQRLAKDRIKGGKGDKAKDKDFSPKEVKMGHVVEGEHTSSKELAAEITRDHLTEDPKYYSKLKDAGLADELEKGQNGDWQKEGYQIRHEKPYKNKGRMESVSVVSLNGVDVARFKFAYSKKNNQLNVLAAEVHPDHQRKGIATAVYSQIEKKTNLKLTPTLSQTQDARALWAQPNRPFGKSQDINESSNLLHLEHYSSQPDLKQIDPKFHGTGVKGEESKRKQNPDWVDRSYHYVAGTTPESMVGAMPHKYTSSVPKDKIYDYQADPLNLRSKSMWGNKVDPNTYEKNIKEAGYHGYINKGAPGMGSVVALFHPVQAQKIEKSEELLKGAGRIAPKGLDPKNTRPDQDVKTFQPGQTSAKFLDRKHAKLFPGYPAPSIDKNVGGIFYPSVTADPSGESAQAFAPAGVHDVIEHEGHHALVDKLIAVHGVDKIHNMYNNLLQQIHPKVLDFVTQVARSVPEYAKMERHPTTRYQLAHKEELVNMIRDFVHGSGPGSRREQWNAALDNPHFVRNWGFKTGQEFDTEVKRAWKTIRDGANKMKPEDLK